MSQIHLNRSLPHAEKHARIAIVKWTIRAEYSFPTQHTPSPGKHCCRMCNGSGSFHANGEAIIISRRDVEKVYLYASTQCDLRDHLIIRLPMKSGLRTREIATLEKEDIDFETGIFQVLDSKKHKFYPVPLDLLTLQLMKDLTEGLEGLVFRHKTYKKNEGKPLTNVTIWKTVRVIGERAGVKGFHPRILRHYFAANMMYPEPDEHGNRPEPANIETLRRILRHANLTVTHRYLARLVFIEDIKRDYDRLQNPYVLRPEHATSQFYLEHCKGCEKESTCKFVDQVSSCSWASGCRFEQRKELVRHG